MNKASFLQRLAAFVFDLIFVAMVTLVINMLALQFSHYFPEARFNAVPYGILPPYPAYILDVLFTAAYFGVCWAVWGQTPGKMALNIKVVRANGAKLGWRKALVRWLGYWISALPLWLGFLWCLLDHEKACWHDKIAASSVVMVEPASLESTNLTWRRWLVAAPMAFVFLGTAAIVWVSGMLAGGFAVPIPDANLEQARWWLNLIWPITLAASALLPPILVGFKARWLWVLASIIASIMVSLFIYMAWIAYMLLF